MLRHCIIFGSLLAVLACGAGGRSDEQEGTPPAAIEIVIDDGKAVTLTAADLAKLPRKEVAAKDHKGEEAKYSGVLLADLLKQASVPLGERLRGKSLSSYLLVEAADKYRAVFSLPEVDPDWTDNVVLLSNSRNGVALDAAHGPFQLVIPAEKRHSRWVKQVVRLTVRSDSR